VSTQDNPQNEPSVTPAWHPPSNFPGTLRVLHDADVPPADAVTGSVVSPMTPPPQTSPSPIEKAVCSSIKCIKDLALSGNTKEVVAREKGLDDLKAKGRIMLRKPSLAPGQWIADAWFETVSGRLIPVNDGDISNNWLLLDPDDFGDVGPNGEADHKWGKLGLSMVLLHEVTHESDPLPWATMGKGLRLRRLARGSLVEVLLRQA
jgi:hypothetical protein